MKFNQFDGSELAINELLPTIFCIIISFIFHSERTKYVFTEFNDTWKEDRGLRKTHIISQCLFYITKVFKSGKWVKGSENY